MRALTSYDYQAIALNLGSTLGKRSIRAGKWLLCAVAYPLVVGGLVAAIGALYLAERFQS